MASGKLREDLLYRLNVFPIHLPPLRERTEDMPLIAQHFLDQICEREGQVKRFTPAVLERLAGYRWPGNVRELRNVVYRAYVMAHRLDDHRRVAAERRRPRRRRPPTARRRSRCGSAPRSPKSSVR